MDFVTVSTDRLRQFFLHYNKNIFVLPNLIDRRIWDIEVNKKEVGGRIVIGYAGSEPHGYDFKPVIPAIRHIMDKYQGRVVFEFIGYSPRELRGLPLIFHTQTIEPYDQYARFIKKTGFDIALAPLEDNTYSEGKSNIKFLEYAMCAYPGIYSRVGPYSDTVVHDETGLLTGNSTQEWIDAMDRLIKDEQLRKRIGANAYQCATQKYSLQTRFGEWVQAYRSIIASGGKKKDAVFSTTPVVSFGPYLAYAQFRECYYFMLRIARTLIRAVIRKGE
jgi:glycosyltransferase involved in cell wall biosynthesis